MEILHETESAWHRLVDAEIHHADTVAALRVVLVETRMDDPLWWTVIPAHVEAVNAAQLLLDQRQHEYADALVDACTSTSPEIAA